MSQLVESVVQLIRALPPARRRELADRLVEQQILSEDAEDVLTIQQRRDEPVIPAERVFAELRSAGKSS